MLKASQQPREPEEIPPIKPTSRPYLRVLWIRTLLYPGSRGGGNSCGGYKLMRVATTHTG